MSYLKVGYLSLVKGSWINEKLEGQRKRALDALGALEIELVDCGLLIQDEIQAAEVLKKFEEARVDVIVAHFITFALGSIVPGMAVRLRRPVIFWSEPEPPMRGGRIEANSFCAVNMNAHALWKMGLKYTSVDGHPEDIGPDLARQFRVLACIKRLSAIRIGLLGGRVPGFYTSDFDELRMREKFGTEVESITLLEVVESARKIHAEAAGPQQLEGGEAKGLSDEEIGKGTALAKALHRLTAKYRLGAWAIRCWPEPGDLYGIAVCHGLSTLTGSGIPSACEGDVYGALTMLTAHALSRSDPFFCDLISFDRQGDTGVYWHCGAAPLSLCKTGCVPQFRQHSIMDGGDKKGVTVEFPLKPGPVTVTRIGENQAGTGYRMLVIGGEAIDTTQLVRGNPLTVRFERPAQEIANGLIERGFEHHFVVSYGDIREELRLFCKLLDIELVEF